MRFNFRTIFRISLLLVFVIFSVSDANVIHKAKPVIVVRRESVPEKTRLADGTKFERYVERDLPPLPIEQEEEADDLNDPRIGHLDKNGNIAVPVDSNGQVLKGFEYLLKPITIDLDMEEDEDSKRKPDEDRFQIPNDSQNEGRKDYQPYQNNQDLSPKSEFLPEEQETNGEEYDDVASDPREPLPDVPNLPQQKDYTDSGESDDDLKAVEGNVDEQDTDREQDDSDRRVVVNEVIIPSSNIELPISQDDVNESSKSADEVEQETEIESDGDVVDGDKSVDIPKNRVVGDTDIDETKSQGPYTEDVDTDSELDENEIDLSEADVEDLAKDFGKSVYENVMNKASEFSDTTSESESSDNEVDPNSINSQSVISPYEPENPREVVAESGDSDGVILPDQSLTDEEIARIAAESLKPAEPAVDEVPAPRPPVRGGRIGSGVQPDSASQQNILLQFFIVSIVMLFL